MKSDQMSFLAPADMPEGLRYAPDFLTEAEEAALAGRLDALPFKPFEFHGFLGKRQTSRSAGPTGSTAAASARRRRSRTGCTRSAPAPPPSPASRPDALEHALLVKYEAGAGLGWHRDRPVFGDVIGISLLSPAPLRFRRRVGAKWQRFTLLGRAALDLPAARARRGASGSTA